MPNHVTSKVTITGPEADVAALKALMIRSEPELYGPDHQDPAKRDQPTGNTITLFDFSRIIPKPEILDHTESSGDLSLGLFALGHTEKMLFEFGITMTPLDWPWVKQLGIETREQLLAHLEKERPAALRVARVSIQAEKETGHQTWYTWSIANWGTKWNAYSFELLEDEPGRLHYVHNTAWSFPEPIYDALSERFPNLRIDIACFDEGWNFAGRGCLGAAGPDDHLFEIMDATASIYEEVYGHPPERFDEEAPKAAAPTAN